MKQNWVSWENEISLIQANEKLEKHGKQIPKLLDQAELLSTKQAHLTLGLILQMPLH